MSTRAYYHPRDLEVDMSDLALSLYQEIASWHGRSDEMKDPPVLTCLGNGEPMYIRRLNGRFYPTHFPYGNADDHTHGRLVTMSDEHRRQTDYAQRAADDHGLATAREYSTGRDTRLDLAVTGTGQVGFEIQRSTLSRRRAKTRAAKSFQAGWPTAWITDARRRPDWADHVPTGTLTAGIDWSAALPARNTAMVSIGEFVRERDRSRTSGWRYRREPRAVLLDELAYLMPAGEIVPVAVGGKGAVSLAFAQAREVIDSCTYPGASQWRPTADTPRTKETAQRYSRECAHDGRSKATLAATPTHCMIPGCTKTRAGALVCAEHMPELP